MKKIELINLMIVLLFVNFNSTAQSIWQQKNPLPPFGNKNDVCFIDDSTGWVVDDGGLIVKTIDGANSWQRQYSYFSGNIYSIFFIDDQTGWIGGTELYKTLNGGESWELQYIYNHYHNNYSHTIFDIFFINEIVGWAGTSDGYILHTVNGGTSWIKQNDTSLNRIKQIFFVDQNKGWALTHSNEILKTNNSGEDWIIQGIFEDFNFYQDMYFHNELLGWVTAEKGKIYKTIDGGNLWDTIQINTNIDMVHIHFFNELVGRALSRKEYYITNDGGLSWEEFGTIDEGLIKAATPSEDFCCAVGSKISNSVDTGLNWTISEPAFTYDLKSICFASEDKIFAIGEAILVSEDNGNTWTEQNSNTNNDLNDVFFIDESSGWIVGENNTLLNTTNSGNTWELQTTSNINDYNAITFVDAQTGWFVTDGGYIMKTNDGGENWQQLPENNLESLFDVFFIDLDIGWVTGYDGTIAHTLDGGENWEIQDTGISENIHSIFFIDENKGWAAGRKYIFSTDNGGNDWYIQYDGESSFSIWFYSIWFSDPNNGWACGKNSLALQTNDGGQNWILNNSGISKGSKFYNMDFNGLAFSDENRGFIIGNSGIVLYTEQARYLTPAILEQPSDTTVCINTLVSFELSVLGDSLNFQWFNKGIPIQDGNTNPLIFEAISETDGGIFSCRVFNNAGMAKSEVFMVSVITAPEITADPTDITAHVNDYIAFNQAVTGTLPIYYQWQKNGVNIPDANFHIYPIESVQLSDTGNYRCIVWNDCGTDTTETAKLTVLPESGIGEQNLSTRVKVFPNPTDGIISLQISNIINVDVQIDIYDITGNNLYSELIEIKYDGSNIKIYPGPLPAGIYYLNLQLSDQYICKKIIIK